MGFFSSIIEDSYPRAPEQRADKTPSVGYEDLLSSPPPEAGGEEAYPAHREQDPAAGPSKDRKPPEAVDGKGHALHGQAQPDAASATAAPGQIQTAGRGAEATPPAGDAPPIEPADGQSASPPPPRRTQAGVVQRELAQTPAFIEANPTPSAGVLPVAGASESERSAAPDGLRDSAASVQGEAGLADSEGAGRRSGDVADERGRLAMPHEVPGNESEPERTRVRLDDREALPPATVVTSEATSASPVDPESAAQGPGPHATEFTDTPIAIAPGPSKPEAAVMQPSQAGQGDGSWSDPVSAFGGGAESKSPTGDAPPMEPADAPSASPSPARRSQAGVVQRELAQTPAFIEANPMPSAGVFPVAGASESKPSAAPDGLRYRAASVQGEAGLADSEGAGRRSGDVGDERGRLAMPHEVPGNESEPERIRAGLDDRGATPPATVVTSEATSASPFDPESAAQGPGPHATEFTDTPIGIAPGPSRPEVAAMQPSQPGPGEGSRSDPVPALKAPGPEAVDEHDYGPGTGLAPARSIGRQKSRPRKNRVGDEPSGNGMSARPAPREPGPEREGLHHTAMHRGGLATPRERVVQDTFIQAGDESAPPVRRSTPLPMAASDSRGPLPADHGLGTGGAQWPARQDLTGERREAAAGESPVGPAVASARVLDRLADTVKSASARGDGSQGQGNGVARGQARFGVQIGQVDIIVVSPEAPPARTPADPGSAGDSLASRCYLRNL